MCALAVVVSVLSLCCQISRQTGGLCLQSELSPLIVNRKGDLTWNEVPVDTFFRFSNEHRPLPLAGGQQCHMVGGGEMIMCEKRVINFGT